MNKFIVFSLLGLVAIFFVVSCADSNRESISNRFAVESVFAGHPKIWKEDYIIIRDVSETDFAAMQKRLVASGFTTWHHIDSSTGFIIEVQQTTIWTGVQDKTLTYSFKGDQMQTPYPTIVYIHEDQIVYCAMTTGLGG